MGNNPPTGRHYFRFARDPTRIDAKRPLSDFIWLVQFLVSCPIFCLTLTLRYAREWQAPERLA